MHSFKYPSHSFLTYCLPPSVPSPALSPHSPQLWCSSLFLRCLRQWCLLLHNYSFPYPSVLLSSLTISTSLDKTMTMVWSNTAYFKFAPMSLHIGGKMHKANLTLNLNLNFIFNFKYMSMNLIKDYKSHLCIYHRSFWCFYLNLIPPHTCLLSPIFIHLLKDIASANLSLFPNSLLFFCNFIECFHQYAHMFLLPVLKKYTWKTLLWPLLLCSYILLSSFHCKILKRVISNSILVSLQCIPIRVY